MSSQLVQLPQQPIRRVDDNLFKTPEVNLQKKRTFGFSSLSSMFFGTPSPPSRPKADMEEKDHTEEEIRVNSPPPNDDNDDNQAIAYCYDLLCNTPELIDTEEWQVGRVEGDAILGIFPRKQQQQQYARKSHQNALILIALNPKAALRCQALIEDQLTRDLVRVCALHAICTVSTIEVFKTNRTQAANKFKTVNHFKRGDGGGAVPFVLFQRGFGFRISRDAVTALSSLLDNARVLAVEQADLHAHALLGVGSTSSVCKLRETGQVCKSVDYSHQNLFWTEKSMLELVQDLSPHVTHLDSALPDSLMLITSPAGVSLNRLPWGVLRTGREFAPLALALHKMSLKGILHRDISPGNIILVDATSATTEAHMCLIDFGVAMLRDKGEKSYSGSKYFCSDAVLAQLEDWGLRNRHAQFDFVDDLESLLKTVLFSIDFETNNLITLAIQEHGAMAKPRDVALAWQRVWNTEIGLVFKRRIENMRAMPQSAHVYIAQWLQQLGWSAVWVGL